MKILLDTNIFLWWLDADKRLQGEYLEKINDTGNVKLLSVASIWEIVIKVGKKKLPLKVPVRKLFERVEFTIIDIKLEHVLELEKLPNYHKDPFDRMLIAQAKTEGCELLTTDKQIKKYF